MARFSDLPLDDLLPLILNHLNRGDYNALVQVSRPLNKETIPYQYRDIKFVATKSRGCARNLALLLRTLLERPQLASHVRSFKLRGPLPYWTKYNPWPEDGTKRTSAVNLWGLEGCTTLSKAQIIFASNQFYRLVDASMHKSQEQFRGRNKDALATLVLTRFTELRTLDLGDGFLMYSLFLPQIMKRADQLFPKLDHVVLGDKRLDPENSVSYMDLDLIRPIFYSDTVSTFEYTMSQPWKLNWNRPQPPRSDSLTMLHLFRTNINRGTLDQLLSSTPNLKRFHYEQEILFNSNTPGAPPLSPYLNLDGLNIALANLKNTLEDCKLCLSMAPGSLSPAEILDQGFQFPAIQGTLTILKEMKSLTKVEVPMVMFLGWAPDFAAELKEVVPRQIRIITLRDDFVPYCPWAVGFTCNKKINRIGEYLELRAGCAPNLQTFQMRIKHSARESTWLMDAARELGERIDGESVGYAVDREKRADMHCWGFGAGRKKVKERASRNDSLMRNESVVIRGMFPST
ncbi:hypothetical protein K458DRAFT_384837 [Lentithecium fluviatile CBS 122367]|uniref:F-box domain-containing protein n=1 Tax=Lentithecium fluviatile CBS 122367 TaxID=1168545 RepID=A0A6G1JDU7_9PLEO|nr:hypothetical protein K458DRAFT_384837 [Lentithecium fluviatile CBS 122367]